MGQRVSTAASVLINGVPKGSNTLKSAVVDMVKDLGTPKVKTGDKFPMDAVVQHTWKK